MHPGAIKGAHDATGRGCSEARCRTRATSAARNPEDPGALAGCGQRRQAERVMVRQHRQTEIHYIKPASIPNYRACLPDISLQFKQSLPNTPKLQIHRESGPAVKRLLHAAWGSARLRRSDFSSEFLVTPMRATRLQLRCNPDSRVGGAYTSSPSNLQFGEADGDAPV